MREILDHLWLRPKLCVWEITARCNMSCLHCASSLTGELSRGEELSLPEAIALCSQLKELGCEKVVLSGGEALLRKDWGDIARELVRLKIKVSLISNGFVLDDQVAEQIRNIGLCRVGLSLDGLEPTHDYIRDRRGSFRHVVRACGLLRERQVPVNLVTHVNRRNLPELEAILDLAIALGAEVWRLQLGSPLGRLAQHPELHIVPADLPRIADFILEAKRQDRISISVGNNIGYFSHHEFELRGRTDPQAIPFWCGCSAGCLTVGIEANGNVKGCLALQSDRFIEGNVRKESLRQIWERPGAFAYTRGFRIEDLRGHCRGCEYGEICRGGCTFMAVGATGSPHDNPFCLHRVSRDAQQGVC